VVGSTVWIPEELSSGTTTFLQICRKSDEEMSLVIQEWLALVEEIIFVHI
jgi:hypothetical protein